MKPLPADFSSDIPEFTDEELEEERAQCDRENAARRASSKATSSSSPSPLAEAKVRGRLSSE
jgi:hypothetical protein